MPITKNWKFYLSTLWIVVTLSLAVWWLINGLNLLKHSTGLAAEEVSRYKVMLISEGVTWMILLVLGGGTLIYFVLKEGQKNAETKKFLASFSHDLKTSIASLRLQAECIKEDVKEPSSEVLINRLVNDSMRLQVQLENSLQFAGGDKLKLHFEELYVKDIIKSLSYHWPDIQLNYSGEDHKLRVDKRAIEIIMRNLIYNAKVHGKATEINISIEKSAHSHVLQVSNNGSPFKGDEKKLGELYYRHNPSSGSGLGLHIVKSLMKSMDGEVEFSNNPFNVILHIKRVQS